MCKFAVPSGTGCRGDCFCNVVDEMRCIVNSCESLVGLLYRSTSSVPDSVILTVGSKKLTLVDEISTVNLIVSWHEFRWNMKASKFGLPSVQMTNMSSMKRNHTLGWIGCVYTW